MSNSSHVDGRTTRLPAIDERGYPPEWDDAIATPEDLALECGGARDHIGDPIVEASGQLAMWGIP